MSPELQCFLFQSLLFPCHHERRCTESRHLPRCNAAYVCFSVLTHAPSERKIPVARKIPFDDPEVLTYVRIGYVLTQLTALAIYYYVSMTVCYPASFLVPTQSVFLDQEKERPNCAQIRLALSNPFYLRPRSPASFSGACVTYGLFNLHPHPRSDPLVSLLQSGDQKGELVTTTVRDYDLSETSKLVRPHPSFILLH